jgi:vacuolar-type H+-ATPase subunit C/Vma6
MMLSSMSPSELQNLSTDLHTNHAQAAKLASLLILTDENLQRIEQATGVSTDPLRDLGLEMVATYIEHNGIEVEALAAAVEAIRRAAETAKYLTSLPP